MKNGMSFKIFAEIEEIIRMESIYKRRTDSDLVEEYKQFEKKMKNGKLTIHEQRMYITLLTEIGDRWIKQIENK